jgi:hypothetical protein
LFASFGRFDLLAVNLTIVKLCEALAEYLVLLDLVSLLAINEGLLALVVVVDQLRDANAA